MKKAAVLILLIIVLGISLLTGCASSTSAFVGTWVLTSGETDVGSITFYSDGSCVVDEDETGEWSVVDGTLKILGPYGGQFWSHDNIIGQYSIKGNTLTITDARIDGDYNDTLIYESDKQKNNSTIDDEHPDYRVELENAVLESTCDGTVYIYRDLDNNCYGLYNNSLKQKITEPIYEYISEPGNNDLMVATLNAYSGYIDKEGNVIIDFQYDEAKPFYELIVSGSPSSEEGRSTKYVAAVKLDGKYGAIDDSNSMLIHFAYDDIELNDYVAIVYNWTTRWTRTLLCGVSSYSDDLIVDTNYSSIRPYDKALFAERPDETGIYDVFDYFGAPRLSADDIEELTAYDCEKIIGFMKCPGHLTAVHCETKDYDRYWILLDSFQPISDQCFKEIASYNEYDLDGKVYVEAWDEHNQENYTTAYAGTFYYESNTWGFPYWTWEVGSCHWVVLDEHGNECAELPDMVLGQAGTYYKGANAYYAHIWGATGTYYQEIHQGLVDIKTGDFTEYKDVILIPDTNCIIVQDIKTDLYGVIDGDHFVRDCSYTNAEWGFDEHNMYIDLTRGGLQETYYAGSE